MIPHLLDLHAVDAAMIWLRRRNAVHALHYDLPDLAKLGRPLEAPTAIGLFTRSPDPTPPPPQH